MSKSSTNMKILSCFLGFLITIIIPFLLFSCASNPTSPSQPPSGCDTTNVGFASVILPIFTNQCSCHSGGSPQSNISLTNYTNIKNAYNNNGLLGAMKGNMYSHFANSCQLFQIEAWINKGLPNN